MIKLLCSGRDASLCCLQMSLDHPATTPRPLLPLPSRTLLPPQVRVWNCDGKHRHAPTRFGCSRCAVPTHPSMQSVSWQPESNRDNRFDPPLHQHMLVSRNSVLIRSPCAGTIRANWSHCHRSFFAFRARKHNVAFARRNFAARRHMRGHKQPKSIDWQNDNFLRDRSFGSLGVSK